MLTFQFEFRLCLRRLVHGDVSSIGLVDGPITKGVAGFYLVFQARLGTWIARFLDPEGFWDSGVVDV